MRLRHVRLLSVAILAAIALAVSTASAQVLSQSVFDGFGDGDRNNDGAITTYDTDLNLSDTLNSSPEDDELNNDRGLIEVTSPESGAIAQSGMVWLATRGFTSSNAGDPKSNLKIFDDSFGRTDNVAGSTELDTHVHGNGYALGVESKGTGSSFVGVFGESIVLGPTAGDKVVVSLDWRFWRLSANPSGAPNPGEMRWGLWQDTDNELGQFANEGKSDGTTQALAEWGAEDGDWFSDSSAIGVEGDKGIYTRLPLGPNASEGDARINWEYNLSDINGTTNNGRFFEGSGVSNTPGSGGDVGTVASPTGDGPGGKVAALGTQELSMEIIRLEDGLVQVASFVNGTEILRDEIKLTDTGFDVIGPPATSFDYIGFRNSSGDYDYVIDNVSIQSFVIPEPMTWMLLSIGIACVGGAKRRKA